MDSRNLGIGIIILLQCTIGILGNFSLFAYYLVIYYKKHKVKPTELILMHLTIVNFLIILSKGACNTMAAFVLKLFYNDWSYQLFMYFLRVFRSMSIITICLLCAFHTITILPRNSCWKKLKAKSPKDIGLCISFCWAFFVFPEVLFSVLITWTSSSMIVILYRHKQRVQYIRSTQACHNSSPESRATQSILVLVFTFLGFYTLSAISHGCNALLHGHNSWLMDITIILTLCFPTLSPFVHMSQLFSLSRLFFLWKKDTNSS
nr:vomeronasal type-1 receptor 4-like [Meriones unguiculatus]